MNNKIVYIGLALIAVIAIGSLVRVTVRLIEAQECTQWQQEAKEYPTWYATDWQVEQCANYDIELQSQQN